MGHGDGSHVPFKIKLLYDGFYDNVEAFSRLKMMGAKPDGLVDYTFVKEN